MGIFLFKVSTIKDSFCNFRPSQYLLFPLAVINISSNPFLLLCPPYRVHYNVDLHHTTLCDLWAFDLSGDPYQPGRIHPLICSCDELGCANIKVRVTENEDSVIWDDFRHGDAMDDDEDEEEYRGEKSSETEDLKLSFEFEKNDYKKKMEKLRSLACASCRR